VSTWRESKVKRASQPGGIAEGLLLFVREIKVKSRDKRKKSKAHKSRSRSLGKEGESLQQGVTRRNWRFDASIFRGKARAKEETRAGQERVRGGLGFGLGRRVRGDPGERSGKSSSLKEGIHPPVQKGRKEDTEIGGGKEEAEEVGGPVKIRSNSLVESASYLEKKGEGKRLSVGKKNNFLSSRNEKRAIVMTHNKEARRGGRKMVAVL